MWTASQAFISFRRFDIAFKASNCNRSPGKVVDMIEVVFSLGVFSYFFSVFILFDFISCLSTPFSNYVFIKICF